MKTTGLALTIFLAVLGMACEPAVLDRSFQEVARVASPDGKAEAVLGEAKNGSTTSVGYYVFVVPPGVKLKERDDKYLVAVLYEARRNGEAYGANLDWSSKERLRIEYLSARSVELIEPSINYGGFEVAIELADGKEDPSAPPGGMSK